MASIIEKSRRSIRYHYYRRKNEWIFPSNMSHLSGGEIGQGIYEPEVSEILRENLREGNVFVDIGANVGYFSRLASGIVGTSGAVYAVEADIENYCALTKNADEYSNIYTAHAAISDNNGFANMNHSTHAACHSLVNTRNRLDGSQMSVFTMTLDHFWTNYLDKIEINFLKIDVEGAEIMVLKGMENILSENAVDTLTIELCPKILKNADFNASDMYEMLSAHFSIDVIGQKYRALSGGGHIDSLTAFEKMSNILADEEGAVNINLLCQR